MLFLEKKMQGQVGSQDPRRPERIVRYVSPKSLFSQTEEKKDGANEDLTPDYMNVLGMIFSMCALMLRSRKLRVQSNHFTKTLQDQVVWVGCRLLLLHQLRQHQV